MPETITAPTVPAYSTAAAPLPAGQGLRFQAQPFAAMGCLFVAAGAARVAVLAAGDDAAVAWAVSGVAFTIAVVAAVAAGRRFVPRKRVLRDRLVAALLLGAGWVAAVAHLGMSLGAVGALAVVGTCLSLAFLREHSITAPGAAPTVVGPDVYVQRWAENLGGKGKPLAGSRLLPSPARIRSGYQYVLELVPGSQTATGVLGVDVRGGLRLQKGQEFIVEDHPELPAPTALLTVVTASPVKVSQPWPGPAAGFDPAAGAVNLGPFADGEGVAQWDVYRENGIFGGFLQGDPGSGKSRMFESIALSVAASVSHPTVVWFACGQGGASSPMLLKHADHTATTIKEFYEMLQAATRIYQVQGKENIAYGLNGFTPTAQRPGLLIFVDELHGLLDAGKEPILAPACAQLMLGIAREARKAGVGIVGADQSPTLDAFGGSGKGMDTLRSCLLGGTGALLKSETNNAKQVFNVDINPRKFPKWPGYGFLARPREGARSAPFRGYWVTDAQLATEPGRIVWRELAPRQAAVAGELYTRRREIAQERRDALLAELDMIDAGLYDTLQEMDRQMSEAQGEMVKGGVQVDFADGVPSVRPVQRFWLASPARSVPMTPGEGKVLAALGRGEAKAGELARATGLAESGVHLVLGKLVKRGLVVQPQRYGPYRLAHETQQAM